MTSKTSGDRGFTLIEVTLAIVIGVVVLAGATVLYRQAAKSAGNVKAQDKTSALAVIVEEVGVRTGRYPTPAQLRVHWTNHRPDALQSPWGGPVGTKGQGELQGIVEVPDPFTTPWEADRYRDLGYAGAIGYTVAATGAQTKDVTDYDSERTRTYRGYVIAIWNQDGHNPCFISGPEFSGHF